MAEEYSVFSEALGQWQALATEELEEGTAEAVAAVAAAARTLSLCVQVTRAQEKDLGVSEVMISTHHLLKQVLVQFTALNSRVASLEAQVARLDSSDGGGGRGQAGSTRKSSRIGGQKKKGKGKEKEVVVVDEESELSSSESDPSEPDA